MANTKLSTSNKSSISAEKATVIVNEVREGLKLVSEGYLSITPLVAHLYEVKAHKALGYQNFDQLCANEFGMSHGTQCGIRKVFDKFGDITTKDGESVYYIPDQFKQWGYTKLLTFTDSDFEKAGINPLEVFTPDMTIREMKDALKLKLEDKAKSQDESAIDTNSTDSADSKKSIIDNSESNESNESNESIEVKNDKDIISEMITTIKALKLTMDYLKPEKAVLLDAIEANLKELKKLAK